MLHGMLNEYLAGRQLSAKIDEYSEGQKLLDAVRSGGFYDIYILDMIMPGMNGLELASSLRFLKDKGKIIFLTATLEYAVASYDVQAFYYMVKPVDPAKLFSVLDNAIATITDTSSSISVKTKYGEMRLAFEDIYYIDIDNRAPVYHLRDGRRIEGVMLRSSFKVSAAPLLSSGMFAMCSVSTIVNLSAVDAMDSSSVLLKDGTQLFPSRSSYAACYSAWKEYWHKE